MIRPGWLQDEVAEATISTMLKCGYAYSTTERDGWLRRFARSHPEIFIRKAQELRDQADFLEAFLQEPNP